MNHLRIDPSTPSHPPMLDEINHCFTLLNQLPMNADHKALYDQQHLEILLFLQKSIRSIFHWTMLIKLRNI